MNVEGKFPLNEHLLNGRTRMSSEEGAAFGATD